MKPCTKLVDECKKMYNSKKYTKAQIRKHEKIKNPNILEQWQLCEDYRNLCHVENGEDEIIHLCKNCPHNVDSEAADELYKGEYEIIWGNVYKREL